MMLDDVLRDQYGIVLEWNNSFSQAADVVFSGKDIYCNMNRVNKGKNHLNIIFVTGFSGSGKSTLAEKLAKKYKAKILPLDIIQFAAGRMELTKDVLTKKFNLGWIEPWMKLNGFEKDFMMGRSADFYYVYPIMLNLVNWIRTQPGMYIVEGIQVPGIIPMASDYSLYAYPIVFKGTSEFKSLLRRFCREEGVPTVEDIINCIKWYNKNHAELSSLRSNMVFKENHYEKDEYKIS